MSNVSVNLAMRAASANVGKAVNTLENCLEIIRFLRQPADSEILARLNVLQRNVEYANAQTQQVAPFVKKHPCAVPSRRQALQQRAAVRDVLGKRTPEAQLTYAELSVPENRGRQLKRDRLAARAARHAPKPAAKDGMSPSDVRRATRRQSIPPILRHFDSNGVCRRCDANLQAYADRERIDHLQQTHSELLPKK